MPPADNPCWVGVDWSDASHTLCILDSQGKKLTTFQVTHTAEGLSEMIVRLRQAGTISGVAVESVRHLVVQKLLEVGFTVFPINPKLSHLWREGWKVNSPKSDPADAWVLAEGLRQHQEHLHPLQPADPATRELALLCADEIALIAQRTALVNQLQATLKEYHPQALQWFSDWTAPTAWDFVLSLPAPEDLQKASKKKLVGFLKTHSIGLGPLWQERIGQRQTSIAWPSDAPTVAAKALLAVSLAKQLRTLQATLEVYRQRIEALFAQHEDADLFSSLPGAGPKLAPRLLSHFGTDRTRYDSAQAVQQLSGTVPITQKSGKRKEVHFRWACQKDFRQTMHLFAFQTTSHSLWSRAYYDQARARGQSHPEALRNLAAKWLKIIFRMWQNREPYDEAKYLAALIRHGSPIIEGLATS